MIRSDFDELRLYCLAHIHAAFTSVTERAAFRRVERTRYFALYLLYLFAEVHLDVEYGCDQGFGVRVEAVRTDVLARHHLDYVAEVHDGDLM